MKEKEQELRKLIELQEMSKISDTILGPEFYNDSQNVHSISMFNNSKIGNLTTIKSQDDES